MKLTNEQKEAIKTIEGNLLCVASAGSGKTQCFTTRIAYMIQECNISPKSILGITFTKKAGEEMKKRLSKMIGKDKASEVPMGTFHSIAYRLMMQLDYEFTKYKIAPQWWTFGILNDICQPPTSKNHNGLDLGIQGGKLASFISYQKANMISPTDKVLIDDNVIDYVAGIDEERLQEAYVIYERAKDVSRQIDFDDMLLKFYQKLRDDEKFRSKVTDQYKYIMIDEYQDSSLIMIEIVKLINQENIFVVGDFRQSIYAFINSRVENILDFKDQFDNVKTIELNKNFRSTQNIVKLSNDIIGHSPIEKYNDFKESESVAEVGEPVSFNLYDRDDKQVNDIVDLIQTHQKNGTPLSEIAILVRTNAQTADFEDILAERDIPYEVNKSASFFDRKEVVDILSYAKIADDLDDNASFRRVFNVPNRYLSKNMLERLDEFANDRDITLLEASKISPLFSEWTYKKNIPILHNLIYQLAENKHENAGSFLRRIVRMTQYIKHVNDTTPTASSIDEKLEAIERLCSIGAKFPNAKSLLAHIATIKDKQSKSQGKDSVKISTIHSAKGLEWDVVFVPNCNEGLIPHEMNNNEEEERRLFYVACSRPRKKLYVSWTLYNQDVQIVNEGIFIKELLGEEILKGMKRDMFTGLSKTSHDYPFN